MNHHCLCTPMRASRNVMHRRLFGPPGLGALLVVVACADQGDAGRSEQAAPQAPPAGTLLPGDSGAQRIVESPASIARGPTGWTVEPAPSLVVGQVTGPEPYLFDGISGVVQLADGSVLVADSRSRQLRIFGLDGIFRRFEGGSGEGPGEFLSLTLAPSPGTDSVVVFDPRQRRYTIFDESLQSFRTLRFDSTGIASGYALGHVLQLLPGFSSPPVGDPSRGVRSRTITFRWVDLDSGRVSGAEHRFQTESMFSANGGGMGIPFHPIPDGAVGIHSFFLSEGREPEIREYDAADGSLVRVVRLIEPPSYATERDFAETAARHIAQWGAESYGFDRFIGDLYAELQPVLIPAFDGILVDSDGWLWARVYDWDRWSAPGTQATASNRWIVFSREGHALGTVDLSPGLEVRFIGTDLVLGSRRTDLGVEVVEGYRLTRVE